MKKKYCLIIIIIISGLVFLPARVWGVMRSTNYTIFGDEMSTGGIVLGENYELSASVSESPIISSGISATYQIAGGFEAMDDSSLSLSISDSSIDLGTLSISSVSSASTIITVSANYSSGYTLAINSATWTQSSLASVNDNTVSAGNEEYGFSISGTDASDDLIGIDNAITAVDLMTSPIAVFNSACTITFKASVSSNTTVGQRTQTISLLLSNNL